MTILKEWDQADRVAILLGYDVTVLTYLDRKGNTVFVIEKRDMPGTSRFDMTFSPAEMENFLSLGDTLIQLIASNIKAYVESLRKESINERISSHPSEL